MSTQFKNLKKGDVLCEAQFYKVSQTVGNEVELVTDDGQTVTLDKGYVEACLISANQYSSEQTINKTDAAKIFQAAANTVITVNFNTKVKEEDVKATINDLYPNDGGKIASRAEFNKKVAAAIKGITEGKERTMVGRHYGELNDLGRMSFIDMNEAKDPSKAYDSRTRQVDPRTINWMIIKGVKYNVK